MPRYTELGVALGQLTLQYGLRGCYKQASEKISSTGTVETESIRSGFRMQTNFRPRCPTDRNARILPVRERPFADLS